jgi:tetratricopeptide (TPR) repeat protein
MKMKFRYAVALILLVSVGFVLNGADNVPKKALKLIEKGGEAMKENNYEKAQEAYDKAIELAPEYAPAYSARGRMLVAQKKTEAAISDFDKALELNPNAPQVIQFYAKFLFQLGGDAIRNRQLDQSNTYFLKMLALPGFETILPNIYYKVLFQLGTNYYMQRKSAESNKYYLKLLGAANLETLDKKLMVQGTYQVGANYSGLKDFKKAIEYFIKLLDIPGLKTEYPSLYLSTLYMVGLNSEFANDLPTSTKYLTRFLEEAKDSSEHAQFMPLANLLLGSGLMGMLKEEVKKMDDKDKVKKIAQLAKSKSEIETYLTRAIELKPDLEPAYMHLGNYYYYCNDLEKAISTYKTLIEKFPNSPDIDQYKKFLKDINSEGKAEKQKGKK